MNKLSDVGYTARQSRDRALTAFAQLAALRLGVRRAMVSLIDSTHQYVLAEATKTVSLIDDSRHAEHDQLWLGSAIVAKSDAICECSMARTITVKDAKGNPYTAKGAFIPDLALDPAYEDKPYVHAEPGLRFYAGVPIRTRAGHMIGVYAVSDEKPRSHLTYDELRFMQDIAVSVMDHLEWARDRVDRYKGERIVRGMADFIEGSPNMREVLDPTKASTAPTSIPDLQVVGDNSADKDDETSTVERPRLSPRGSHITNIRETCTQTQDAKQGEDAPTRPRTPPIKREKADNLSRMLDRAARILRESTLAEGVVFFGPNGSTTSSISNYRAAASAKDRLVESTATEDEKRVSEIDPSTDSDTNSTQRPSKILGISLTNKRDASLFQNTALTVPTLESYFKSYPHGKSFHFSEAGSGLSSEDDSSSDGQRERRSGDDSEPNTTKRDTEQGSGRKYKIKMDHAELLKNLPGVRNVIFLPLWDYMDDKMVAGAFLWTSSTGRMMTLDEDLSYLRAFGNTIMSEVARMSAQKDDRAKTTFIASMSHELRSPLHGILGSVEFLQDTPSSAYQASLITSIATCGKTLLDTLDHVLDYAKINKLGKNRMRRNAKSQRVSKAPIDSSMESLNILAEVDLSIVVEEVVEAVCAGHAFKMQHAGEFSPRGSISVTRGSLTDGEPSASMQSSDFRDGQVSVLLDISPRTSWKVRTQPGALRRIIMNLLGNALKYTSAGFVAVSLHARENSKTNKIDVVFRVTDSGKGMSEDFQKNRLFVPFSQEDTFQPGTGLGLSIVRQIVDSLGGSIELKSEQGVGTEFEVNLSLAAIDAAGPLDKEIATVAEKMRKMRLCLLDPNGGKTTNRYNHIAKLDATLKDVCTGWFDMDITKSGSMTDVDADIFMYTEPPSIEYLLQHHAVKTGVQTMSRKEAPLIIVCLNAAEAIAVTATHGKALAELGRVVELIPQPCGPRKMAKVLSQCMRRVEEGIPSSQTGQPVTDPLSMGLAPPKPQLPRTESEDNRTSQYLDEIAREAALVASSIPPTPPADIEVVANLTDIRPEQMTKQEQQVLSSPPASSLSPKSKSRVPHVLLVDDNRINLQLLVMFMKKHKFTFAEAQNGLEALHAYMDSHHAGNRFDFVLMDISMPVMDGMTSTRRIRDFEAENGLSKATVIALTGLASAAAQQEAESSGIDIYMPKPVKFQELRPLLARKDSGPELN